jgi:hypothetical protein
MSSVHTTGLVCMVMYSVTLCDFKLVFVLLSHFFFPLRLIGFLLYFYSL